MSRLSRLFDFVAPPAAPEQGNPRWLSGAALAFAAASVGYAIHVRDGEYIPEALTWIGRALALCVVGVALPRVPDRQGRGSRLLLIAVALAVALQFHQLVQSPPGGWNWWSNDVRHLSWGNIRWFYYGVTTAIALSALLLLDVRRVRLIVLPLLFATHFAVGVWMIRSCPLPKIDVFAFQQLGPEALLKGRNPYAMEMPDIYYGTQQERDRAVYGEGLSADGKLKFGFPYPPVSLYLATAGYAIAGDHRYAQLAAMTLAGAFIAFCRPGRVAALAAVLLLFTPRGFFVLGRGWTEPFVVLMAAAVVFCACRNLRWATPIALGLLFAVKQYMVFALPLALLLVPRPWGVRKVLMLLVPAGVVAAVVSAPLALWDFHAFYHSAATVQKVAPFREDALSYLVPMYHADGVQRGVGLAFIMMLLGMALSLWRCPRDPAGFAAAMAMTYLPFIAFNKQAFANYYHFVIGVLCCAVGALPVHDPRPGDKSIAPTEVGPDSPKSQGDAVR